MKDNKTTIERLCAHKKIVADKAVLYRLFRIRNFKGHHFAINVSADNESTTCSFGTDRTKALKIYRIIVRNGVTPCTLNDIAEDFVKSV